jgi:hypothetical protein
VFSASYCKNMVEEGRTGISTWENPLNAKRAADILSQRGVHDAGDVISSLRTYLDLDPQIALSSTDPVLKAMAVIDRRVGKRTLESLPVADEEHSLVRTLYLLRMKTF